MVSDAEVWRTNSVSSPSLAPMEVSQATTCRVRSVKPGPRVSDLEFERLYGTEEKCREALFAWRWPEGFACPACGGVAHCELEKRALWQCNVCRTQTSLTAGTIFAATKLDLTVWFRAMLHMTQTKQGISALELSRRLDVSYNTAWAMHHKLRQVMLERNQDKPLDGRMVP